MQVIYDLFRERATWPTFAVLDLRLDRRHHIDAKEALKATPARYVRTNRLGMALSDQDEVRLTLLGVACADGSAEDLAMVTRFVKWVARQEQAHDDESGQRLMVTSDQASKELGLDLTGETGLGAARRLWFLIELLPTIHSGASWREDEPWWQMTVSREVREFRDLAGSEDLVGRVDDYWTRVDTASAGRFTGLLPVGSSVAKADVPPSVTTPFTDIVSDAAGEVHSSAEHALWGQPVGDLVAMRREDLALLLLKPLRAGEAFHPLNEATAARVAAERGGSSIADAEDLQDAVVSAANWLENEGYVVLDASRTAGWMRITKTGATAAEAAVSPSAHDRMLRGFEFDPRLSDAFANFELGQLDAAVTLAMKALEIAVREAAGLRSSEIGESLMRRVFGKNALLSDPRLPDSENLGLGHLYAGAILWWRNPAGHRIVRFAKPQEAAEVLLVVNHLLRIVARAQADKAQAWIGVDSAESNQPGETQ